MRYSVLTFLIFAYNFTFSQAGDEKISTSIPPPPAPPSIEFISENNFVLFSVIITLNKDYLTGFNTVYILEENQLKDTIDLSEIRKKLDINKNLFCNIDTVILSNVKYFYRNFFGYRKLESAKVFKDSLIMQYIKFGDDSIPYEKTFFKYDINSKLQSEITYDYWSLTSDSVEIKRVVYEYNLDNLYKRTTTNYCPRIKSKHIFESYYNSNGKIVQSLYESYNESKESKFEEKITYDYDNKGRIIHIKSIGIKDEELFIRYVNNKLIITYLIENKRANSSHKCNFLV